MLDPSSYFPPPEVAEPTRQADPDDNRTEHCYDLMAANFVMSIISTICLSAMGNRIGLETVSGGGVGWEAGVALETFTIFFTGISGLICIARNRTASWVFTVLSMIFLFGTVIATATSFHEI